MFYGVLDLLAKPVFAIVHLIGLRSLDYDALGLQSGKRSAFLEESGHRVNGDNSGKALEAGHASHPNTTKQANAPAPAVHAGSPSEAHTAV